MTTLAEMALLVARLLPGLGVIDSVATGGTATSLVDAAFPQYQGVTPAAPATSYFVGGTIWFKACASTSLTGRLRTILTSTASGAQETFTFSTFTPNVAAAGDLYAVCDKDWPWPLLYEGINEGMRKIGGMDLEYEDAAFVTVAYQKSYDIPSGVYGIKRLYISQLTDDPYDYQEIDASRWHIIGSHIVFDDMEEPDTAGLRIKLLYNVMPTELSDWDDVVPVAYPQNWLRWEAASWCLRKRNALLNNQDETIQRALAEAMTQAQIEESVCRPLLDNRPQAPAYSIWS